MGLFTKQPTASVPAIARLGSGRRLRSDHTSTESRAIFDDVLSSYRPRKYPELPHVVDTGYQWLGAGAQPEAVVSGTDSRDEFLAVAIWPTPAGSEIAVFPLGSGDQRLAMPITGHWKVRDSSLTSIGTVPANSLALREPRIAPDYIAEVLQAAGYPCSTHNLAVLSDMFSQQFLVKAHQFIGSKDPRQADRFVASHQQSSDLGLILHDLVAWNPTVAPYIQDLPYRVRALALDAEILSSPASFWAKMRR